jgi:hypothetical protein
MQPAYFLEIKDADYSVNGISCGCLCTTNPHYAFGTAQSGRKWVRGTAVARFSLDEREVYFENIKIENVGRRKANRLAELARNTVRKVKIR